MLLKLYLDDKTYENMYNVSRTVTNTSNPYIGTENMHRFLRKNSSNVQITLNRHVC